MFIALINLIYRTIKMAKTYPVKWFNESMQGAGQTTDNTAGTMIAILKACLVDGFGALSPDSIVWDSESQLAKASFSAGHSYLTDSIIVCSGSTPIDYDGEHRVIKVTTNDMWFELDTVPIADAGGTLEIKIAPLGWELSFQNEDQNTMIFTPAGNLGNVSLRVDNSDFDGWYGGSTYRSALMKVAMVENATDVDTYDTIYEHRWSAGSYGSDRKWDLVGDNRILFFLPEYGAKKNQAGFYAGYIDSIRAGDNYHFIMNNLKSSNSETNDNYWSQNNSSSYNYYTSFAKNNDSGYQVMARPYHQLEGTVSWMKIGLGTYSSDVIETPNPTDNGFYINAEKAMVMESSTILRGYMPIMVYPLNNNVGFYRKNLQELPEFTGKIFRMLKATYEERSDYSDVLIGFDISTLEG